MIPSVAVIHCSTSTYFDSLDTLKVDNIVPHQVLFNKGYLVFYSYQSFSFQPHINEYYTYGCIV